MRGVCVGFFFRWCHEGAARIRTQMNAALTREDLDFALDAFVAAGGRWGCYESSGQGEGGCRVVDGSAPVPEIGPEEVLIKVHKTGICGTDIHIWNWDDWAARTVPVGLVTGHEFAGEIVEMGALVQGLAIGQRCSGEGHLIGELSRQSRAGSFTLIRRRRGSG